MTYRIETERLILRTPEARDLPNTKAYLANWQVARMLARVPHPYQEEVAEAWLERRRENIAKGLPTGFSIIPKDSDSDTTIGDVWLGPRDEGNWRLGYWLAEPFWGRGYMSEATEAALKHAKETWNPDTVEAGVYHDNPGSKHVLEKLGFQQIGTSNQWCEARQCEVPHIDFILDTSGNQPFDK